MKHGRVFIRESASALAFIAADHDELKSLLVCVSVRSLGSVLPR